VVKFNDTVNGTVRVNTRMYMHSSGYDWFDFTCAVCQSEEHWYCIIHVAGLFAGFTGHCWFYWTYLSSCSKSFSLL